MWMLTLAMVRWAGRLCVTLFRADGRRRAAEAAPRGLLLVGGALLLVGALMWLRPFAWRPPGGGVMTVAECGGHLSAANDAATRTAMERTRASLAAAEAERRRIVSERDEEREASTRLERALAEAKANGSVCLSADLVRAFNRGAGR